MNKILEICCYSLESVKIAAESGAHRVELCSGRKEGGTTPSLGLLRSALREKIEVYPIIRPRGGDFLYSESEFQVMKNDIEICREEGVKGVVFGILNEQGHFDLDRMRELIQVAGTMDVTVHRAFDMSSDLFVALEELISIGIKRVLSSGGKNTAFEGREIIKKLNQQSDGRISIMAGSGVNSENIQWLMQTGIHEFHSSASSSSYSKMKYKNPDISMGKTQEQDEFVLVESSPSEIRKMIHLLQA